MKIIMKRQLLLTTMLSASLHFIQATDLTSLTVGVGDTQRPEACRETTSSVQLNKLINRAHNSPMILTPTRLTQINELINYGDLIIESDENLSMSDINVITKVMQFERFENHGNISIVSKCNSDFLWHLKVKHFDNSGGCITSAHSLRIDAENQHDTILHGRVKAHNITLNYQTKDASIYGEIEADNTLEVIAGNTVNIHPGAKIIFKNQAIFNVPSLMIDGLVIAPETTALMDHCLRVGKNIIVGEKGIIHGAVLTHMPNNSEPCDAQFINKGLCVLDDIYGFFNTPIINTGYVRLRRESRDSRRKKPLILQNNEGHFRTLHSVNLRYTQAYLLGLSGHISGDVHTGGVLNVDVDTDLAKVTCVANLRAKEAVNIVIHKQVGQAQGTELQIPGDGTVIQSECDNIHILADRISIGANVLIHAADTIRMAANMDFNRNKQVVWIGAAKSLQIDGRVVSPKFRASFCELSGNGEISSLDVKLKVEAKNEKEAFILNDNVPHFLECKCLHAVSKQGTIKVERRIAMDGAVYLQGKTISVKAPVSATAGIVLTANHMGEIRFNEKGTLTTSGQLAVAATKYTFNRSKSHYWKAGHIIVSSNGNDSLELPQELQLMSPKVTAVHSRQITFNARGNISDLTLGAPLISIQGKAVKATGTINLEGSSIHTPASLEAPKVRIISEQLISSQLDAELLSVNTKFMDGTDTQITTTEGRIESDEFKGERIRLTGNMSLVGKGRHELTDVSSSDAILHHQAGQTLLKGDNRIGVYIPDSRVTTLDIDAFLRVKAIAYAKELAQSHHKDEQDLHLLGTLCVEGEKLSLRPGGQVTISGSITRSNERPFEQVQIAGRDGIITSNLSADVARLVFEERLKLYGNQLIIQKLGIKADVLQADGVSIEGKTLAISGRTQLLKDLKLRVSNTHVTAKEHMLMSSLDSVGDQLTAEAPNIMISGKIINALDVTLDAGSSGELDALELHVAANGVLFMSSKTPHINADQLVAKQVIMEFDEYQNGMNGAIKLAHDLSQCEHVHVGAKHYRLEVNKPARWRPNMALAVKSAHISAPLQSEGDIGIQSTQGITIQDSIFAKNIDLMAENGDINFYLGLTRAAHAIHAREAIDAKAKAGSIHQVGGVLSTGIAVTLDASSDVTISHVNRQPALIQGGTGRPEQMPQVKLDSDGKPILDEHGNIMMEDVPTHVGVSIKAGNKVHLGASHLTSLSDLKVKATHEFASQPYVWYEIQTHSKTRGFLFRTKTVTTVVIPHVHKSNISAVGKTYVEVEAGGISATGTDFISGDGTYLLARDNVEIRDVIAQTSTTIKKSSGFLSPSFIATRGSRTHHARDVSTPVHLLSQREIYLRSRDGAIYGRGILVQTPDAVILQAPKGIELTLPILQEIIEQSSWSLTLSNPLLNAAQTLAGGSSLSSAGAAMEPLVAHIKTLSNAKGHLGQSLTRASMALFNDLHALSKTSDMKSFLGQRYGLTNADGSFTPSGSIGYQESYSKTIMHHVGMGGLMARTAYFLTHGDLRISNAFPVDITEDAYIRAENFYLTGAKLDVTQQGYEFSLNASFSGSSLVGVSGSYGEYSGEGHVWAHGRFTVGRTLEAHIRDTIQVRAAQISAAKLRGSAKKIVLISETDEFSSQSSSSSASVSWGGSLAFSVNGGLNQSNSKRVTQRAGIFLKESLNEAGDEFVVHDSTTLVGAVIQSDGFMKWISQNIEGISIDEHTSSESTAFGISLNPNAAIMGELSFNYEAKEYKGAVHACITGKTGSELRGTIKGNIVNDLRNAHDVHEDSNVEFGFIIPLTTPDRINAALNDMQQSSPFSKPWTRPSNDSLITQELLQDIDTASNDSAEDAQADLCAEEANRDILKDLTAGEVEHSSEVGAEQTEDLDVNNKNLKPSTKVERMATKLVQQNAKTSKSELRRKIAKTSLQEQAILKKYLESLPIDHPTRAAAVKSGFMEVIGESYTATVSKLKQFYDDLFHTDHRQTSTTEPTIEHAQEQIARLERESQGNLGFWGRFWNTWARMEAEEIIDNRIQLKNAEKELAGAGAAVVVGAATVYAPKIMVPLMVSWSAEEIALLCECSQREAQVYGIIAGAGAAGMGSVVATGKYIMVELGTQIATPMIEASINSLGISDSDNLIARTLGSTAVNSLINRHRLPEVLSHAYTTALTIPIQDRITQGLQDSIQRLPLSEEWRASLNRVMSKLAGAMSRVVRAGLQESVTPQINRAVLNVGVGASLMRQNMQQFAQRNMLRMVLELTTLPDIPLTSVHQALTPTYVMQGRRTAGHP